MAETQAQIEKLDSEKSKLIKGEVANNFHIPRVGYYHAEARNFFEHPYGFEQDGRYFINGVWQDQPVAGHQSAVSFHHMKSSIRLEANAPRPGWQQQVEASGLIWHGAGESPYWAEDQHLVLTLKAAETLEDAASELHALCLEACEQIVKRGWWDRLAIPEAAIGLVQTSWMTSDFSTYGRFDLAWDGKGQPKLLEYNADLAARGVDHPVAMA